MPENKDMKRVVAKASDLGWGMDDFPKVVTHDEVRYELYEVMTDDDDDIVAGVYYFPMNTLPTNKLTVFNV